MSTHFGPSSEQALQAIIPVRPTSPETARASSTPAGLLRRTLGTGSRPGAPSATGTSRGAPSAGSSAAAHLWPKAPQSRRTLG